jgi:hypothetical protein
MLRENELDEQNAQVGTEAGGRRRGAVSGVDSVRVRVHLYERSFPEEPNNAFSVGATAVDTTGRHRAAHSQMTRRAPFCRTTNTRIVFAACDRARRTRAAKSAARQTEARTRSSQRTSPDPRVSRSARSLHLPRCRQARPAGGQLLRDRLSPSVTRC